MKTFLNTPWRVERNPGEILVVDTKNMIVASFDVSEPYELPGEISDEEAKAYLVAAAPGIHASLSTFLDIMTDPAKCLDEDLVMQQLDHLQMNLLLAAPEPLIQNKEPPSAILVS